MKLMKIRNKGIKSYTARELKGSKHYVYCTV